jgi:hypothetical protein
MNSGRLKNFRWPEQLNDHQLSNTKMFASRESVLKQVPKNISYLEIGVLAGDYSHEVIKETEPEYVALLDTFDCNDSIFTQRPPRFRAESHLDFVTQRFASNFNVQLIQGTSHKILPKLNTKFDYIYIDADHTYEAVTSDLHHSMELLQPGGLIGLNDYIMWDYLVDFQYGVVQAVNDFLHSRSNWEVKYFALVNSMFCDIYLAEKV